MAGTPTRVLFTTREQGITSDLNRMGKLAGREAMDRASLRSVRADFYDPPTNAFDDFTASGKAAQAIPIDGLTRPPSLEGVPASFDMALGAGEGQMVIASPDPDLSSYQQLRWGAQTIAWPVAAQPDPGDPRICLIVATSNDVPTDLTSRNILLDPVTRAVSPGLVYKTSSPQATISVVAGAAAASPLAPAVPAGALALFEVYLPAGAADSTAYLPVRRAWRQIEFPGTSQHGIVKGCEPITGAGFAAPILPTVANKPHRLVIDGELLTFACTPSSWLTVDADTVTPPVAAPAGNDAPAFLYLCGGRHAPHLNYKMVGGGATPVPVTFIASLTPPDGLGHPTADLAIAAPVRVFPRAACCYVGLYFREAGATTMVQTYYEGDWIRAATLHNFVQPAVTAAAAVYTAIPMPTCPVVSNAMRVRALVVGAASALLRVAIGADPGGADDIIILGTGATFTDETVDAPAVPNLYYKDLVAPDTLVIRAVGFNMNVPRLAR